jgi:hypothetical protein
MKKFVVICVALIMGAMLVSAGIRRFPSPAKTKAQKVCTGFTVIEASRGIDCHGDTIQLRKVNGFYTLNESSQLVE